MAFHGRGRGRGRGGGGGFRGGRGRGRSGGNARSTTPYSGPSLPFALRREISAGNGSDAHAYDAHYSGGGRGPGRKELRRAAAAGRSRPADMRPPHKQAGPAKKRPRDEPSSSDDDDAIVTPAATRRAVRRAGSPPSSAAPPAPTTTPFQRLLAEKQGAAATDPTSPALLAGRDEAAAAAEAALQRRLARKLGLKKGKGRKAAEKAAPDGVAARELATAWAAAGFAASDDDGGGGGAVLDDGSDEEEDDSSDDDGLTDASSSPSASEDDGGEEDGSSDGSSEGRAPPPLPRDRGGGGAGPSSSDDDDDGSDSGSDSGASLSDLLPPSGSEGGGEGEGGDSGSEGGSPPPLPPAAAPAAATGGRYVPPARRRAAADATTADIDTADAAARRAVTGALNRLADGTLPAVGEAVLALVRGGDRRAARPASARAALVCELVKAAESGPRATPAFAAAAAGLVAGVAGRADSPALAADAAAAAAAALERAVAAGDGLAASNLTGFLCALYGAGALGGTALFGLLTARLAGFGEADVAVAAATLRAVGGRLRADDPAGMKAVVLAAASKAAAARAAGTLTPRADALLGLVLDVKNGRVSAPSRTAAAAPVAALSAGSARWVREGGGEVGAALAAVEWQTLLAPERERVGAWWLPRPGGGWNGGGGGAGGGAPPAVTAAAAAAAAAANDDGPRTATASGPSSLSPEALARLAAAHGMAVGHRRAVFVAVMTAADAADGAERLLRLRLPGPSAREAVRVPLECALSEAAWNPYYPLLIARVARGGGRAARATLRLSVRDALRGAEAGDPAAWPPRKAAALARLAGWLVSQRLVPLASILPPPPPSSASLASPSLPARRRLVWRALLRAALAAAPSRADAVAPFDRLAAAAAHSEAAAFGAGNEDDDDEYVAAMAAAAGGKRRKDGGGGEGRAGPDPRPSSPAATPSGCAALRAFIRTVLVPWLVEAGPAPGGVGGPGGPTVGVDELTLRARDAERAAGRGAKSGGARGGGLL